MKKICTFIVTKIGLKMLQIDQKSRKHMEKCERKTKKKCKIHQKPSKINENKAKFE